MVFGAGQAEPQRTILFFAEIARRSFVRTGGREHSNLKLTNGKNVDKDVRRGFVFALAYFFFGLLYYIWKNSKNMQIICISCVFARKYRGLNLPEINIKELMKYIHTKYVTIATIYLAVYRIDFSHLIFFILE